MIPDPVFVSLGTNAVTGVKIRRNFFDFFDHNRRRQKRVKTLLDPFQFVIARDFEINDLAFGVDPGIRAATRGRDLHLASKITGEGFLKNFLNGRPTGLFLEPEKHRAVVFEDQLYIAHRA